MASVQWLRQYIGRDKIFMVSSTVIVQNEAGEVLLQHRTDFDEWAWPGGGIDLGETISECAKREVLEETGLEIDHLELLNIQSEPRFDVLYPNGDQTQQVAYTFLARVTGGEMRVDGVETKRAAWMRPSDVPTDRMRPWYGEMLTVWQSAEALPALTPPERNEQLVEYYKILRPHVGHAPLILPGVIVVVQRDNGDFLLVKRSDDGSWFFPAGFQMIGENVTHAGVREVREETGCDIIVERILGVISSPDFFVTYQNGDQVQNVGPVLLARAVNAERARADLVEVTQIAWVSAEVLIERTRSHLFAPLTQTILKQLSTTGCFLL